VHRYILNIEGVIEEIEDVELPHLPVEGDPIETKYGTYVVTKTEDAPEGSSYDGRIFCRAP
jgi:hypothetical protein